MSAWLLAAFLVAWGNLLHPIVGGTAVLPGGSWQFVAAGAALTALSLLAAGILGLDAKALGLRTAGGPGGAAIGVLLGGSLAALGVLVLRIGPAILGEAVVYEPLRRVSADDLTLHIAFFLPLGAVVPEEVAFRGLLLGALRARHGSRTAVLGSAVAFAMWHATVAVFTVMSTTMPAVLIIPAIAGAFIVLVTGGAIMSVLRLATGSLAASVAAHWAFNAVILIGLWNAQ